MTLSSKLATILSAAVLLPAHAVVITFDGLTGGTVTPNGAITYPSPVVIDGFAFTTLPITGVPAQFATWTTASNGNATFSNYTGSISLFSNTGRPTTMTASGGQAFNVSSLSLGAIYRPGNAPTVNISGVLAGGGTVTQSLAVPANDAALRTVTLTGFTGLSSFTLSAGASSAFDDYQFDNINAQVVPEASTTLMLGVGLLALLGVRRQARFAR